MKLEEFKEMKVSSVINLKGDWIDYSTFKMIKQTNCNSVWCPKFPVTSGLYVQTEYNITQSISA